MGDDQNRGEEVPERYRLSDGGDARKLLDELDGMLKRGEVGKARRWNRKVVATLPEEDREIVLRASTDRWRPRARAPLNIPEPHEFFQNALKDSLMYPGTIEATTVGLVHSSATAATWAITGNPPDLRDAETIAREFLARVDQLLNLPGGEDMAAVVARARDEVLEGVPKGYRRKVVERILRLEERDMRESGAAAQEVAALEAARDERREHAWKVLGAPDSSRRRR